MGRLIKVSLRGCLDALCEGFGIAGLEMVCIRGAVGAFYLGVQNGCVAGSKSVVARDEIRLSKVDFVRF